VGDAHTDCAQMGYAGSAHPSEKDSICHVL
jgi:hypothetical protein